MRNQRAFGAVPEPARVTDSFSHRERIYQLEGKRRGGIFKRTKSFRQEEEESNELEKTKDAAFRMGLPFGEGFSRSLKNPGKQ